MLGESRCCSVWGALGVAWPGLVWPGLGGNGDRLRAVRGTVLHVVGDHDGHDCDHDHAVRSSVGITRWRWGACILHCPFACLYGSADRQWQRSVWHPASVRRRIRPRVQRCGQRGLQPVRISFALPPFLRLTCRLPFAFHEDRAKTGFRCRYPPYACFFPGMHDETLAQPILFRTPFKSSTSISILSAFVQWWVCGLSASGVRMDCSARAVLPFAVRNSVAVGSFPCPALAFPASKPPPRRRKKQLFLFSLLAVLFFFLPGSRFLAFGFDLGFSPEARPVWDRRGLTSLVYVRAGVFWCRSSSNALESAFSAMQQQPPLLPWISREKPDLHRLKMAIGIGQRPCLASEICAGCVCVPGPKAQLLLPLLLSTAPPSGILL